jgi:membrane fusion protein, multidrug efflux system
MNTESEPTAGEQTEARQTAPEQQPRRRRRRWMLWTAALCLVAGGIFLISQRLPAQNSGAGGGARGGGAGGRRGAGGAIPVSAATVTKGNMNEYIEALGTVTSVYTVSVASRVAGTLTEVHYKEGQIVHKGELLAVIDPRPYTAVLLQAQGQLDRDQALLANARIDVERYKTAYAQHAIPQQTLATQQATVAQDEGTVKLDQGNLDAAKVNVDYTQITSPIDGRTGLRTVDPGNIVVANGTTALVTITQLQPITVIFTMAENYVDQVFNEMRTGHKLRVDALNRDDESELAQGTLFALDSQIDTTTGTVRARATFANKNNRLFPNEFVNARLLIKTLMGVNIVPNAAIQRNNEIAYVYVINRTTNTVRSYNVTVATTDGTNSAVTGVSPGQVVVTDGFDKLQDGTKVVIRKVPGQAGSPSSTMNQARENMQSPTQGAASANVNTAQQNPQAGKRK